MRSLNLRRLNALNKSVDKAPKILLCSIKLFNFSNNIKSHFCTQNTFQNPHLHKKNLAKNACFPLLVPLLTFTYKRVISASLRQ